MRKDFGAKPMMYPMNVLIIATYNEDGTPDAMNAAWGGIADHDKIMLAIDKTHKTAKNIVDRKAFTVSMATASQMVPSDYVGIVSGNDVPDKFARAGFHALKSEKVDAPLIEELPMALECRLISFDPATEILFGEIVNVCADESILNAEGNIDPVKLDPIIFDGSNRAYYRLGEKVGDAFRDGAALKK
ncbi:MAG: flavin reductase family protein [Thermoplasmata archaeon]|nr:flavin reductase family protein [Thermoplasmata archaeon]